MNKFSRYFMLFVLFTSLLARAGGDDGESGGSESGGGGGDPRVTEFLSIADSLSRYLHKKQNFLPIDLNLLDSEIAKHRASVATLKPTIQFLPSNSVTCFGAAKSGCTQNNGRIEVAGLYWNSEAKSLTGPLNKCILVAQEFFVHQQAVHDYRYDSARYACVNMQNPNPVTQKVLMCMQDQSSLAYCAALYNAQCKVIGGKVNCDGLVYL